MKNSNKFRIRRSTEDDIPAILDLFNVIRRTEIHPIITQQLLYRQFYSSYYGEADRWVVEVHAGSKIPKIMAHHGVLPIHVICRGEAWKIGKTIKSMLHPLYQRRFQYLRFERRCLNEIENNYDALYSTNPGTARLRSALGYNTDVDWLVFERKLSLLDGYYNRRKREFDVQEIESTGEVITSHFSKWERFSVRPEYLNACISTEELNCKFANFHRPIRIFSLRKYWGDRVAFICRVSGRSLSIDHITATDNSSLLLLESFECLLGYLYRNGYRRIHMRVSTDYPNDDLEVFGKLMNSKIRVGFPRRFNGNKDPKTRGKIRWKASGYF